MQEDKDSKGTTGPTPLHLREKFAYGLGDVGNNLLFDMGQIYLLKFYTDSLGLSALVAGMVFLVTKIWDAFADMAVGTWIDGRKNIGKRGKFRPFMLYATLPLALVTVVSFTTPDFTLTGRTIWAYATYMAFGTLYSIFNIPYGSMIPAMTQDPVERSQLASFRWAGANLGLLIAHLAFIPIVIAFDRIQTGYIVAASVFALFGMGFQLLCYRGVKERYVAQRPEEKKKQILSGYLSLFDNVPLLVLCLVNLFTFSAFNVKLAVQVYFCQYSLNDTSLVSPMGLFAIGCAFAGTALVPWLVKKTGKKYTYILGSAIWAFADIMAWFFVKGPVSFVAFACLAFFGSSFINTLNWALVSDAVEYGEWKTGTRSEGLVYSFFTFSRKLSQAVAGLIPGIVLTMVGYVPNAVQSLKALNGIKGLMFIYPAGLAIATIVCMGAFYKLSDSKCKEIIGTLNERKARSLVSPYDKPGK